jgi:hypothetical protein
MAGIPLRKEKYGIKGFTDLVPETQSKSKKTICVVQQKGKIRTSTLEE